MLSVSSSTALHPVKDTLTESRSATQESAPDFRKLLAAEVGGDDKAPDAGASDPQVGIAADATGNGPGIPGNPSLKDSEDTDGETGAKEDCSGKEGNMTAEMLAGGFQLSRPATVTAIPGITDALHLPGTGRTPDTVSGIETRIPADMPVQQQPDAAFSQGNANDPHRSAVGRITSAAASIGHEVGCEARAGGDAKLSDPSGLTPGENVISIGQVMGAGMYLSSAIAGGSQEGQTTVRTASSRIVSAPAAGGKLPQDMKFTGVAAHEMSHSDSAFSESRRAGISSSIGDFLPDAGHLRPASAAGSDTSSLSTLTAPVVPHELLTSFPSPRHLIVEPGAVPGIADPGDPSFRLEPRVGTGSWDNALGQRVLWMVSHQHQIAELNLNPPELGPLQVVLSVNSDQASAAFVSQNPEVRQALEAALPRLKEMMAESGINLGNATVSDQGSRQQGDFERQNSGRSHYRQEESRIASAGISLGMSRSTADIRGHQLVDTFA
ncbi:flagellar hook-length control protein FliK [Nitrosospira multiformis]|uniref:Flagellar hook-length control protein FliK n=1 Tax=Nitrosospira multiformis TaxID=1231 RepID=A0A1I7II36_9PROT|nr:flagellar hook-length control protein FliK [Nitrosospira multiformis]SFU72536.1 flagellar hook-length control protein FliK [Nitrosospira multiformis]